MADVVALHGRHPIEAPIAAAATGTVVQARLGRAVRIASLTAERAALLHAFQRVMDGDLERIENQLAALGCRLEDR